MIRKFPFESEDETISSLLVPGILFSFMGIGLAWYEFHNPEWTFLEVLSAIILVLIVLSIARWLLLQVDLLKETRQKLMESYRLADNHEEKKEIQKELEKLYVSVK